MFLIIHLPPWIYFSCNTNTSTNINESSHSIAPVRYALYQNYPNPFNPVTSISYSIPTKGMVTIKIFDINGREVETLVQKIQRAGNFQIQFNGSHLASGIYLYCLKFNDIQQTEKFILLK